MNEGEICYSALYCLLFKLIITIVICAEEVLHLLQ